MVVLVGEGEEGRSPIPMVVLAGEGDEGRVYSTFMNVLHTHRHSQLRDLWYVYLLREFYIPYKYFTLTNVYLLRRQR